MLELKSQNLSYGFESSMNYLIHDLYQCTLCILVKHARLLWSVFSAHNSESRVGIIYLSQIILIKTGIISYVYFHANKFNCR